MANEVAKTNGGGDDRWVQPVGKLTTLESIITLNKKALEAILPKHLTFERVLKMATIALSRQPKLFQCTSLSIVDSVTRAVELGLDFSGTLGEGWLVPYKNNKVSPARLEAQFIPGYRGYIKLMRNSGELSTITAHVVYEDDQFELRYGTEETIIHKPKLTGIAGKKRVVLGAYAVGFFRDGTKHAEFMDLGQLQAIRKRSKASDRGPWVTDTEEMYRKTVVRRITKYMPLSSDAQKLEAYDNEVDGVVALPGEEIEEGASFGALDDARSRAAKIADRLDGEDASDDQESSENSEEEGPASTGDPTKDGLIKELGEMASDYSFTRYPEVKSELDKLAGDRPLKMSVEDLQNALLNIRDLQIKAMKAAEQQEGLKLGDKKKSKGSDF